MPKGNRILYDNFYTAMIGLGFILGPMIGGAIKGILESGAAVRFAAAMNGIHCLYLISTAGILLLQVIYYRVQGKREVCVHVKG
ncbi:MAG: hypothetical protein ACLRMZ_17310 [Blautia marasmi]